MLPIKKEPGHQETADARLPQRRPNMPLAPLDERKPIVLNEADPAIELKDPTDDVSVVFQEQPPKKTISIIVQRPAHAPAPSRNSRDLSRPGTPIPCIFISQDLIETELMDILERVSRYRTIKNISDKDVEASQRGVLGRFTSGLCPITTRQRTSA
ncbi:hypothetical protein BGX27_001895 [Mortierella sp. AM989]|nr:hypothetical protein BGX27_001895 [Mortierella sp. AM989]